MRAVAEGIMIGAGVVAVVAIYHWIMDDGC
jgi:hypothetical protein